MAPPDKKSTLGVVLLAALCACSGPADAPPDAPLPDALSCPRPDGFPPASLDFLTGPNGSQGFGRPALAGEYLRATVETKDIVADRLENLDTDAGVGTVAGHGYDGSITVHTPEYRVGRFYCPEAWLIYKNLAAGPREYNYFMSDTCCVIDVTRADPQVFAGTFAGLVLRTLLPGQGISATITRGAFFVERVP